MTSGEFSTSNQFIKYNITVTEASQNVSANYSVIDVSVRFWRTNTGYVTYGSGTMYCRINGTLYTSPITGSQQITHDGIDMFVKTGVQIPHNQDGTKSVDVSAWISITGILSSEEQGFSAPLTTIARASQPSINTWPQTVSSVTIGDEIVIHCNQRSDSFTHSVSWEWGSQTGTIADNVKYNCTWRVPESFADSIPNSNYGTLVIKLDTYSGAELIGTNRVSVSAYVPQSMAPVVLGVSAQMISANTVVQSWGMYLQGFSKARITANVETKHGASIAEYTITGGGYTGTVADYTTGLLNQSGDVTFTYRVKDSRGLSGVGTVAITVSAYTQPLILDVICRRSAQNGADDSGGAYVFWQFRPQFAPCQGNNTASVQIECGTEIYQQVLDNNATINGILEAFLSASASYRAVIVVTDALGMQARYQTVLPTDNVTIHGYPHDDGGICFGGYLEAQDKGRAVFKYPARFRSGAEMLVGTQLRSFLDFVHPIGSLYWSSNSADPGTLFGGTWERIKDKFILAAGDAYTAGSTGGEATHQLTVDELPSHDHGAIYTSDTTWGARYDWLSTSPGSIIDYGKTYTGGNQPHNNMPPYEVFYCWKRIS